MALRRGQDRLEVPAISCPDRQRIEFDDWDDVTVLGGLLSTTGYWYGNVGDCAWVRQAKVDTRYVDLYCARARACTLVATRKRQPSHPIQGVKVIMVKTLDFAHRKSRDPLQTSGH